MRGALAGVLILAAASLHAKAMTDADRDSYVESVLRRIGMPGVQTLVLKNGKVVWSRGYGNAVVVPPGPTTTMKPDSILILGSVSKPLIGTAVLKEAETGRFSLDDDIGRSLPFPVRNPRWPQLPITWRMLLTHTSSIHDVDEVLFSLVSWGSDPRMSLAELMKAVFVPGGSLQRAITFAEAKPGTERSYCNYCFDLAAYALERVAGEPFHEYVKREIFAPLQMADTGYLLRDLPVDRLAVNYGCTPGAAGVGPSCVPARVAFGHAPAARSVLDQQISYPDYPCGRLRTSAIEYAKFLSMIMNGGSVGRVRILKPSSVDAMLTPSGFSNELGWDQGLAFQSPRIAGGTKVWGHGGEDWGVSTAAFFDRQMGVAAIAFGNSNNADFRLTDEMTDLTMHLMSWFQ